MTTSAMTDTDHTTTWITTQMTTRAMRDTDHTTIAGITSI